MRRYTALKCISSQGLLVIEKVIGAIRLCVRRCAGFFGVLYWQLFMKRMN